MIKKTKFLVFWKKNAYHTNPIYGKCITGIFFIATQKNFPSYFEITPKIVCFFFNCKLNFVRKQPFSKKIFCMQNLIFCVHNVVLNTIMLGFLPFRRIISFSKMLKIPTSFDALINV